MPSRRRPPHLVQEWCRVLHHCAHASLLIMVSCCLLVGCQSAPEPTEATLRTTFATYRTTFIDIQRTMQTIQGTCTQTSTKHQCTAQQTAMQTIGVQQVMWGPWNQAVWFRVYIDGMLPTAGTDKGIVYFTIPPDDDTVVQALDDVQHGPKRIRFQKIEDHWYLYVFRD